MKLNKKIIATVLVLSLAFAGTCFADNGHTDGKRSIAKPANNPVVVEEPIAVEK